MYCTVLGEAEDPKLSRQEFCSQSVYILEKELRHKVGV